MMRRAATPCRLAILRQPTVLAARRPAPQCATKGRTHPCRAVLSSSDSSSVPQGADASPAVAQLRQWVLDAGGFMHPDLVVVEQAPCGGGRGIICTRDVSAEEITGMPMLLVPEDLLLTAEVARHGFANHYEPQGAPPLQELDEATQLAVMLAHERLDGDASFYHPYIAALPEQPPCAWMLTPHELQRRLNSLAGPLDEATRAAWLAEVQRYREAMERHAEGAVQRYGRFFPLTASDFLWAMGHVLSRSFASTSSLSLIPLVDLCNHRAGADHPEALAIGGDDADRCMCVSSINSQGEWQGIKAGQELLIRYFDAAQAAGASATGAAPGPGPTPGPDLSSGLQRAASAGSSTAGASVLPMGSEADSKSRPAGAVPSTDALLCFLSHGHVFPELWLPQK